MAYTTAEGLQEILDELAKAADELGYAVNALGDAYEQVDEQTGDTLEERLYRPVQGAYGRARRVHAEFAQRAEVAGTTFEPNSPRVGAGARELIEDAVEAVGAADVLLSELQDSMLPVEVGDPELRAGLSDVREHVAGVPVGARDIMRVLGPVTELSDFSGWIDPPSDPAPALAGDIACDVCVVGGGYTGMAAALRLAERGADVVLVEAAFCGWGASSRNAGHLTPTIAGDPQLLATVYRRRAPRLVRFADDAVHFAEGLVERLGIDCEYDRVGNVSAALTGGGLRRAEAIARVLADAGGEVEVVEGGAFGLPSAFTGGVLEKAGGVLNPGLFARGLRAALLASRARVYEATAVRALGDDGSVETPGGRVRADRVLLATNAFTRDLESAPRGIVAPLWVTLAETEPIEPERLDATGWTSRAGVYTQHVVLESYRVTRRDTIVYGSRNVAPPAGAVDARLPDRAVVDDITRGLHDRFPTLSDVQPARAWGGWIAMTPSWLPVAGAAGPRTVYAVGYNGHGIAQAPYLGTLVADRLAGDAPHEHLETVWKKRPRFAPAPLFTAPALRLAWRLDRLSDRLL